MKIISIVGARPQFIKAGVVSSALQNSGHFEEIVVHTGQHFDENMSAIFFEQLNIKQPAYNLNINGGSHGVMTGKMLQSIEEILINEKPERLIVYGDTNSTLAGALAASKLHIPITHIEAGLRSFNMRMPEEINRVLTDQLSDTLFCPTDTAVKNLEKEGFKSKPVDILNVGDVMQDSVNIFSSCATKPLGLPINSNFILATVHRAENTDKPLRLKSIIQALNYIHSNIAPVVLPLHPRTKSVVNKLNIKINFHTTPPVGYFEMLWLLDNCELVLTDSGGVQKEAFFFQKSCVTLRDETEWVELVDIGANSLVSADFDKIVNKTKEKYGVKVLDENEVYGGGRAVERIINHLLSYT